MRGSAYCAYLSLCDLRCLGTCADVSVKWSIRLENPQCSIPKEARYSFMNPLKGPTQGLLATDHVILNHGQVTWTTPELAPNLLTTTPQQVLNTGQKQYQDKVLPSKG
ncbi:hypothetical protein TNCV_3617551 [Trichonephila clavipes]|nr:hypothetical protein TNCV_3617551 [Trichonephila clavipes]